MTRPPVSCSTRSTSAPIQPRLTAVQARIRMPGLPRGRRHARCARLSDVQHDPSTTSRRDSACRAPSIRATPSSRRFGGWFVTGSTGAASHMGNDIAGIEASGRRDRASVEGLFDADGYRALSSDIVAHLVFTHQVGMANLLTRPAGRRGRQTHCCIRRSRQRQAKRNGSPR